MNQISLFFQPLLHMLSLVCSLLNSAVPETFHGSRDFSSDVSSTQSVSLSKKLQATTKQNKHKKHKKLWCTIGLKLKYQ